MNRNLLLSMALLLFAPLTAGAGPTPPIGAADGNNPVFARVGEQEIRATDLRNYAIHNPIIGGYLSIPGQAHRVLDDMIETTLFLNEARRLNIAAPPADQGGVGSLLDTMRKKVAPRCEKPGWDEARQFYENNDALYSTPLFLRLSRISFTVDSADPGKATEHAEAVKAQLNQGLLTFEEAVEKFSTDEYSKPRKGDLGFVGYEKGNDVLEQARSVSIGTVFGPIAAKKDVSLFLLTSRREPILEPYDGVKEQVLQDCWSACNQARLSAGVDELKKRWPVVKVKELPYWPSKINEVLEKSKAQ